MPTLIALLRGINIGGNNKLPMPALKSLISSLGYTNPRTLLNSGNLLFDTPKKQPLPALEKSLEAAILEKLKVPADVLLRTPEELGAALDHNPFKEEAHSDPSHLVIMFFKQTLPPTTRATLQPLIRGRERIATHARELYITYPDSIGTSKFTNTLIEKALSLRGTARNWNTLQKIAALAS